MAEETPKEYKESIGRVSEQPGGRQTMLPMRNRFRLRTRKPQVDYADLKAAMAELKLEMQTQHKQTRAVVQDAHREVLAAIKASPAAYVKIACEFTALFLAFSLAVRFALKIELLNPIFAAFALFAMAVYWCMAHVKEKTGKRQNQKEQA